MELKIGGKIIGQDHPVFIIAEAGVNHNGSIELGKKLIDAAVEANADAVKFQTFITDNIIVPKAPKSSYHIETTGSDNEQSWYELLKTQEMSEKMHVELIKYCTKKNIIFLSTPYDEESADLLEGLNVPGFKIASTDTSNTPLLAHIARKGRPMILSSAMATMDEVSEAINTVKNEGLKQFALLQCTGNYPTNLSDSNLRVIKTYMEKFNCVIGFSDHTSEKVNPIAATAMGAKIYEKHFTVDKSLPGPDHRMSLSPNQLKETVDLIRETERALGSPIKKVLEVEKENRVKLRKSIISNYEIPINSIIKREMISIKRPGSGIPPSMLEKIIGKKVNRMIKKFETINFEDLE